jgi:hypothetical protein
MQVVEETERGVIVLVPAKTVRGLRNDVKLHVRAEGLIRCAIEAEDVRIFSRLYGDASAYIELVGPTWKVLHRALYVGDKNRARPTDAGYAVWTEICEMVLAHISNDAWAVKSLDAERMLAEQQRQMMIGMLRTLDREKKEIMEGLGRHTELLSIDGIITHEQQLIVSGLLEAGHSRADAVLAARALR